MKNNWNGCTALALALLAAPAAVWAQTDEIQVYDAEISDQGVTIGEDANIVRLSHVEWNELIGLIKAGELRAV